MGNRFPGEEEGRLRASTTHRYLVEAKHGMLRATAYGGRGTHFSKYGHLHSRVSSSAQEHQYRANLPSSHSTSPTIPITHPSMSIPLTNPEPIKEHPTTLGGNVP